MTKPILQLWRVKGSICNVFDNLENGLSIRLIVEKANIVHVE